MGQITLTPPETVAALRPARRGVIGRFLLHVLSLIAATAAFVAYQHFKLNGSATAASISLIIAAVFAFAPVRALLGELFAIERKVLHAFHGVGALALIGLTAGGLISGGSLLSHAALAPFALMGAAQALEHQNRPRNPEQAAAMRRFAGSLPEVAEFTRADLTSPANAARAVSVLNDLITKAEALGETELKADPNFQSALSKVSTHAGLTLGLDSIDQAISKLADDPAAASAVPELRRRLAKARSLAQAR